MAAYWVLSVLLVTVLAVASAQPVIDPAVLDPVADPSCDRGIKAGAACCPAQCGVCGGLMCNKRPGGPACCKGAVLATGRACAVVGSPCDRFAAASPAPSMTVTTTPPTTSAASTTPANIDIWKNIDSEISGTIATRSDSCFVMVRGKGYLLGGRGLPVTNIFNPQTRTWTDGAAPPFEFHHAQCVVFRNKVFVPASYSGDFPAEVANARMLVYDTKNDRWSSRPGLPEERRRGAAASVLFDAKLYVVGGSQFGHGVGSKTVGWMDYYDLATKKWEIEQPTLPIGRDHTGAAIIKGKLCVAGGRISSRAGFFAAVVRSTWCYDFTAMTWTNVRAPLPGARAGAAYGKTCDGYLMVAGGEGMRMRPFSRVDLFDGTRWIRSAALVQGRHSTGVAVARCAKCSQIFIAAGNGKQGDVNRLDSTEVFLPGGVDEICTRY